MESTSFKKIRVPASEVVYLVNLLQIHGCKNVEVVYSGSSGVTFTFFDEQEYLIFVIGDLLRRAKKESSVTFVPLDFAFMARVEKKIKSYDPCNNRYVYRL